MQMNYAFSYIRPKTRQRKRNLVSQPHWLFAAINGGSIENDSLSKLAANQNDTNFGNICFLIL